MFTLKKHLFPLVFCFCWKGRPLSNEQRQRLVPAPWQRHGGRSYSNSSPNWRGKAYGWGSWKHNVWWISQSLGDFLWDVIFFWSWKSMKYVMHIYIYYIQMNIYIYIFYTPIRNILYTYEFYVNMHHIDKKRWCVRHLSTKIQNFNGKLWCLERRRKFKAQEGRRFPDFHLPVWIESLGRIGCATDFHQTWVPGGSQDLRCK